MKNLQEIVKDTDIAVTEIIGSDGRKVWTCLNEYGMEIKGELGYKVFNPDWTCRDMKYEAGKSFTIDGVPSLCNRGLHYCTKAADFFNYYGFDSENKVALVLAYGDIDGLENDKHCTDRIFIIREIPWGELLGIVNGGKDNTGMSNIGNSNTGNRNIGNSNTGHSNFGSCCTGDFNIADDSAGVFCMEKQTVKLFDKESGMTILEWRRTRAFQLLNQVELVSSRWINPWEMTDQEKEAHPSYETTGGFLRVSIDRQCYVKWWKCLDSYDRSAITNIPNFDAEKFKTITGIDVNDSDGHTSCYCVKDRLQPGDRVVVRADIKGYDGYLGSNDEMAKLAGKEVVIKKVCSEQKDPRETIYSITEDNGNWCWCLAMFDSIRE